MSFPLEYISKASLLLDQRMLVNQAHYGVHQLMIVVNIAIRDLVQELFEGVVSLFKLDERVLRRG